MSKRSATASIGLTTQQRLADCMGPLVAAGMLVGCLILVVASGRRLPYTDDFFFLPYVVGDKEVTLRWLLERHNEHRIPLVKGVMVPLLRLTGFDYRAPIVFNSVLMACGVAVTLLAARRLRGRGSAIDALVPLLLLNPGQAPFRWGFEMQFTFTASAMLVIVSLAATERTLTLRRVVIYAASGFALLGSGVNGVLFAPFLAVWLLLLAHRARTSAAKLAVGATITAVVLLAGGAATFVGFPKGDQASPAAATTFAGHLLGSGTSRVADVLWPMSIMLLVGLVVVGASTRKRRWSEPAARVPTIGLSIFALGFVAQAMAIGLGRARTTWDTDLIGHYGVLFLPLVALLYLSLVDARLTAPSVVGVGSIVAISLVALLIDARPEVQYLRTVDEQTERVEARMRSGEPTATIVAAEFGLFYYVDDPAHLQLVTDGVDRLRRHGQVGVQPQQGRR